VATVSTQVKDMPPAKAGRRPRFVAREMWASLAIAVMWLVVLFDALLGPDIISSNAGANFTRIPSAVIVAFFAYLATRVVAKYGLGSGGSEDDDHRAR
jgi:hypothetical protein